MNAPRRIRRLDISVFGDDVVAGTLSHTPANLDAAAMPWSFSYSNEAVSREIALTMPAHVYSYASHELLPPFEQSLPEMDLSILPAPVAKVVRMDQMGLLWASGNRRLGRLRFAEAGHAQNPGNNVVLSARELQASRNSEELFLNVMSRMTEVPGVAGVQPKMLITLAREEPNKLPANISTDNHILKACRPETPYASLVETLSLKAAARAGMKVNQAFISADGKVIAVHRFDVDPTGRPRGFDEVCALRGLLAKDKYTGSYEDVAKTVADFVAPEKQYQALARLFRQIIFTYAIENGDAHQKNFGLLYDNFYDADLSPAYDMLTTTCFEGTERDHPALALEGVKLWGEWKAIAKFGRVTCQLGKADIAAAFEAVRVSLERTLPDIAAAKSRHPAASEVLTRVEEAWARGIVGIAQYQNNAVTSAPAPHESNVVHAP